MLQITERDRDIVQVFVLGAMSTTHTIQQAVNLSNVLAQLKPIEPIEKTED